MRWPARLGFPTLVLVALACSSSESTPQPPAAGGGGQAHADAEAGSPGGSAMSGGSNVVAPKVGDPGNCCSGRVSPGCDHEAVEACVCSEQSYCCNTAWDTACVRAVNQLGCGICQIAASDASSGGAGGEPSAFAGAAGAEEGPALPNGKVRSCCESQARAGCGDAAVEACVCYVDPYCCERKWDRYCASEVESLGCASCTDFAGSGAGGSP